MKHISKNYNERIQDSANIIPTDEPVFLLRAQDRHAPAAVRAWASRVALQDGNDPLAQKAFLHADAMEEWQAGNGGAKSPTDPAL